MLIFPHGISHYSFRQGQEQHECLDEQVQIKRILERCMDLGGKGLPEDKPQAETRKTCSEQGSSRPIEV